VKCPNCGSWMNEEFDTELGRRRFRCPRCGVWVEEVLGTNTETRIF